MPARTRSILQASAMQSSMLMPVFRGERSQPYVQQFRWSIKEDIDWDHHIKLWKKLLRRHDVFYHQFKLDRSGNVRVIQKRQLQVQFSSEDWGRFSTKRKTQQLNTFLKSDLDQGFQSARNALCRFHCIRMGAKHYELIITSHHAILDGRSRRILIEDFIALWSTETDNNCPLFEDYPKFSDYLHWHNDLNWEEARAFWSKKLSKIEEATSLEIGYDSRPKGSASGFGTRSRILYSKPELKKLRRWSNRSGFSLNIVAQATWAILLSSFSGKKDIVFAAPRACRRSSIEGSEKLVGLLLNTLPVSLSLEGTHSVSELLKQVLENWNDIRPHEHTPYHILKEASQTSPQKPLFTTYLSFENYDLETVVNEGEGKRNRFSLTWFTEVPVAFNIKQGDSLHAEITFDKSIYSTKAINQLIKIFRIVFDQLIKNPGLPLSDLKLTDTQEQKRILKLGTGKKPILKNQHIHKAFEFVAEKHPQKGALRSESTSISYQELNEQANRLARLLKKEGLQTGNTVGLFFERQIKAIVAQLAVLKAGGVFVPLNPSHPSDRIGWMLKNSKPKLLLTESAIRHRLRTGRRKVLILDELASRLRRFSPTNLKIKLPPDQPAYIMYTSGSTGRPKGVIVPHIGIVRLVQKINYTELSSKTRALQLTSLTFDLSTYEIWGPLLNGGVCVLFPGEEPEFTLLKKVIRSESINTMLLSASVFNSIIDEDPSILKGVKQLVIGAEALSPKHVKKALRRLPLLKLVNGYGPTEASALNNCFPIPRSQPADRSVPIGPPISHSSSLIFDHENRLLPSGVPGELLLGGIGLADGYLGNKTQTKEKFIPNPLTRAHDPVLYRTGDRAFMHADGNFDYIERFDDQLKIRGHRIEPGEIRAHIIQLEECRDCRVMPVKNQRGEIELRAFVVLENNAELTGTGLKDAIGSALPSYMIPSQIVFLESLPLNSNGKVDRQALARIQITTTSSERRNQSKPTPTEKIIASLWTELLGVKPYYLDLDFFEAGGHSLLATSLIFRIQRRFKSRIPFTVFETHSTIRGLARWIDEEKSDSKKRSGIDPLILKPLKFDPVTPLGLKWRTFCVPDIKKPEEVKSLLITRAVVLEGDLKPELLCKAMEQVINANERLRTHGLLVDDECFEKVLPSVSFKLRVKDLTHLPKEKAFRLANGIFRKESLGNMSMRYAPQVRIQLLKLSKNKFFLSFVIQHAVADGYAVEMFYKQTSKAYNRLLDGNTTPLRPTKFSYREFEAQLESWLASGNERRIKAFWKRELKDIQNLPYPFLVKNVPDDISWNQLDHYWFKPEWRTRIKSFCKERKITTFTFFSTLVKVLISKYTGELDSYYTSAVNGRTGQQQENIFGDFACTIMVRTKLNPSKSFVKLAESEASKLYTCLDHKYISVNGLDEPHKEQVAHAHSPFGQLHVIEGADTGVSLQLRGVKSKFLMRTRSGALARLGFIIRETKHSLQITFVYAPTIFVPHSIDRLKYNFQSFIELVLQNPNITLNQLPKLSSPKSYQKQLSSSEKKRSMLTDGPE